MQEKTIKDDGLPLECLIKIKGLKHRWVVQKTSQKQKMPLNVVLRAYFRLWHTFTH